jgi:hypothetical protein
VALGDTVSKILLQFKADTSQAKSEIRALRGEEKKAAQERLAELDKTNKGIEDQIKTLAKIGVAVGSVVVAYKAASAAARSYLEDLRLESAAAGANINGLKSATNGLVEADKLLAFAGKAQAGVWKLNQQEMEVVLRGATALRKTMGVDLTTTVDTLTEAVAKGSTRALKEFGIEAESKQDVLDQLNDRWKSLGGNVSLAGDEFEKTGVKLTDSFDDIKGAVGEMVLALRPLIDTIADVLRVTADVIKWLQGGELSKENKKAVTEYEAALSKASGGFIQGALLDGVAERVSGQLAEFYKEQRAAAYRGFSVEGDSADRFSKLGTFDFSQDFGVSGGFDMQQYLRNQGLLKKRKYTGPSPEAALAAFGGLSALGNLPELASQFGQNAYSSWQTESAFTTINQQNLAAGSAATPLAEGQAAIQKMLEQWELLDAKRKESGNLLATIFGTSAEMNETIASIKLASSAFGVLTDAAGSAFDAWITGSESLGKAFAKAIAEGLKATAVQMFVESLKHTAFGFGALAFGPIMGATAAAHFKAAAVFGAGALVAGASAKALGQATGQWQHGGGAGASAGGSGAARTIGSSPSREQDQRPINVYVGAEWAAMSKLEQSAAIQRAIQLGKRGSRHIRRS